MPKLLERGVLTDDRWQFVDDPDAVAMLDADAPVLLPLATWRERAPTFNGHEGPVGVWVEVDTEIDQLADAADSAPVIAIHFPAFNDGRGLSLAVLLRTRLGFRGELRAIGAVHEDVVHYMDRCGFDTYSLAEDRDLDTALRATVRPLEHYQSSVREPQPVFRRLKRA